MRIEAMPLWLFQTNSYFVIDETTRKALIIDPSGPMHSVLDKIQAEGLQVEKILITHGHLDHISGVEELRQATGAEVFIHQAGKRYLEDDAYNLSGQFGVSIRTIEAVTYVEEGDTIALSGTDISFTVLHTPGHTLDGVCYYSAAHKVLFSGDTLFRGNVGRTDFVGGDGQQLLQSIRQKLLSLPADTVVYPGHDRETTIGQEKRTNRHFS